VSLEDPAAVVSRRVGDVAHQRHPGHLRFARAPDTVGGISTRSPTMRGITPPTGGGRSHYPAGSGRRAWWSQCSSSRAQCPPPGSADRADAPPVTLNRPAEGV
jgi:hypothetical protein